MALLLPDLVPLIVSDLDQQDILECMKVCRKLYSTLAYTYYHRITLLDNVHLRFLEATNETRLDGSKIGDFVEHLSFYFRYRPPEYIKRDENRFLHEKEFHQMIHNLPRIVKISFSGVVHTPYLDYLRSTSLSELQLLEEIAYPVITSAVYPTVDGKNLAANARFRDRITTLSCCRFEMSEEFSNLKHLSVIAVKAPHSLVDKLNEYNRLISFECDKVLDWGLDRPHKAVLNDLKSFKVMFKNMMKKPHIDYITKCMPNLKSLYLNREHSSFVETLAALDKDTLIRFQKYLKHVDQVTLRDVYVGIRRGLTDVAIRDRVILDFIQGVCLPGTLCNLKVHFSRTPFLRDFFIFEKHDQKTLNITTVWLMDILGSPSWTDRLDFLTFSSITLIITCPHVYGVCRDLIVIQRIHTFLIQPIIALLERKQQEKMICPLFLRTYEQRLMFHSTKDRAYYPSPDAILEVEKHVSGKKIHSKVDFGYVQKLLLTDDLLRSLGRLYPFVEHLTFVNCLFEDKQRTKQYHIDLTLFKDIHQFTFDFDAMSKKKFKRPLYIILTNSEARTCYYFNERVGILQHVDSSMDIDQPATVIKVSHTRIRQFTFRRHKKNVYIK